MKRFWRFGADNGGEADCSDGLTKRQRRELVKRHRDSLRQYGYSTDTLFWSSRGVQKLRFRVLAEVGIQSGDSVLDIGCGFADLDSWLQSGGLDVRYTGIDLSREILTAAQHLNPQLDLHCGELVDFNWSEQSFDWVVLSGTLNWQLGDDGAYASRVIARMFALCRKGVAFNMLDARSLDNSRLGDLRSYNPIAVAEYCRTLSPSAVLRDDYLDQDFTVYLWRMGK